MPTSPTISPDDIAGAFAASGAAPAQQQGNGPSADDIAGAFAASGAAPAPAAAPSPSSYTPKPLNALPPVAQAMFNRVGENCTGTECGQYISNMIASHGGGGTATSLMQDPRNRVKPGPGGSLPDGTGVFFPSRSGNPNGQHFVLTYTDQNGVVRALEDTQAGAGGGGQRRVRADRTLAQIQQEHGTQPVFFRVPGGSTNSTPAEPQTQAPPIATLPGGAQQYRSPQGADPFALPGSPIAQFEQQHGGLMARTVQNGLTRAVARSGAVQWFDGKGRVIPPPPAPANTPSFGQQFALAANDVYGEGGSAYKPSGPGFLPKIPADLAIAARGVGEIPEQLVAMRSKQIAAQNDALRSAFAPQDTALSNKAQAEQTMANQATAEQVAGLAPYGTGAAILKASQAATNGDTATAARLVKALPAGAISFIKQHPVLGLLDTLNIAGAIHGGIEGVRGLRGAEPVPEMNGPVMEASESGKPTTISTSKPLGNPAMVSGEGLYTGPKIIGGELQQPKAEEIAAAFEAKPESAENAPAPAASIGPSMASTAAIPEESPIGPFKSAPHGQSLYHTAAGNMEAVTPEDYAAQFERNKAKVTLTPYSPEELAGMQRGKLQGADIYYALKDVPEHDVTGQPEKDIVGVMNNDARTPGVATPAVMLHAIENGATTLDAWDVNGFLPDRYARFGFQEIARFPYDESYGEPSAELKDAWKQSGWKDGDPYPDVVYMKYGGLNGDSRLPPRQSVRENYLRTGSVYGGGNQEVPAGQGERVPGGDAGATQAPGASGLLEGKGDASAGGGSANPERSSQLLSKDSFSKLYSSLHSLSDPDLQRLGLSRQQIAVLPKPDEPPPPQNAVPPSEPPSNQGGSSVSGTPKKPAAEYAGSINIGKLSDDELKDAYTQRATALGFDNQEPLTRQQMRDQGRALGLTQDALVRLPVGWKPNNVHFGVWLSAVRDADDLAHVAEANAKKAAKTDPTPENQAALDTAKKAADATFQRRSAISREWGQSGQVLKTPSDPFAAAKEGDLFRQEPAPVVKTGRMKRVPAEERVKSDTFGKANTRYTAADTDAAIARIDARFRAAKLADIGGCKA